jgi:hypothetical protein
MGERLIEKDMPRGDSEDIKDALIADALIF